MAAHAYDADARPEDDRSWGKALDIPLDGCLAGRLVNALGAPRQGNHVRELLVGQHLVDLDILESASPNGRGDGRSSGHRVGKVGNDVRRGPPAESERSGPAYPSSLLRALCRAPRPMHNRYP